MEDALESFQIENVGWFRGEDRYTSWSRESVVQNELYVVLCTENSIDARNDTSSGIATKLCDRLCPLLVTRLNILQCFIRSKLISKK